LISLRYLDGIAECLHDCTTDVTLAWSMHLCLTVEIDELLFSYSIFNLAIS